MSRCPNANKSRFLWAQILVLTDEGSQFGHDRSGQPAAEEEFGLKTLSTCGRNVPLFLPRCHHHQNLPRQYWFGGIKLLFLHHLISHLPELWRWGGAQGNTEWQNSWKHSMNLIFCDTVWIPRVLNAIRMLRIKLKVSESMHYEVQEEDKNQMSF